MSWLMMPGAQALAQIVSLDPARDTKVLDISASHAIWGLSFAQCNPRAHIVALDWAPVLKVGRENAERLKLTDRFSTIEGSAFDVDFGRDYDLILLPELPPPLRTRPRASDFSESATRACARTAASPSSSSSQTPTASPRPTPRPSA
jgi:hypothetical protein